MDYISYFLAVPLPNVFQKEFEALLEKIDQICPNLETVRPATPHITTYYFGDTGEAFVDEIAERVEKYLPRAKNLKLSVGTLGLFSEDNPSTLFLKVYYPPELIEFNRAVRAEFTDLSGPSNLHAFHPHLTIACLRDTAAQQEFIEKRPQIEDLASAIMWEFPVSELVIYGSDSTQQPELQEKIRTLKQ